MPKLRKTKRQRRTAEHNWWKDRFLLVVSGLLLVSAAVFYLFWIPQDLLDVVEARFGYLLYYFVTVVVTISVLADHRAFLREVWFVLDVSIWLGLHITGLETYILFTRRDPTFWGALLSVFFSGFILYFILEVHKTRKGLSGESEEDPLKVEPLLTEKNIEDIKEWRAGGPPS